MLTLQEESRIRISRCARCGGFMVEDRCIDLNSNNGLRCVQCGERLDPVILHNRLRQSVNGNAAEDLRAPIDA